MIRNDKKIPFFYHANKREQQIHIPCLQKNGYYENNIGKEKVGIKSKTNKQDAIK